MAPTKKTTNASTATAKGNDPTAAPEASAAVQDAAVSLPLVHGTSTAVTERTAATLDRDVAIQTLIAANQELVNQVRAMAEAARINQGGEHSRPARSNAAPDASASAIRSPAPGRSHQGRQGQLVMRLGGDGRRETTHRREASVDSRHGDDRGRATNGHGRATGGASSRATSMTNSGGRDARRRHDGRDGRVGTPPPHRQVRERLGRRHTPPPRQHITDRLGPRGGNHTERTPQETEDDLVGRVMQRINQEGGGFNCPLPPAIMNNPLTRRVRRAHFPREWRTPDFVRFNGTTDPDLHMMEYQSRMAPNDTDDQLANMFQHSLKDAALRWFHRLPEGSIDSFGALRDAFIERYACSRSGPKDLSVLFRMKQGSRESLKDFAKRFKDEALQLENVREHEAMACVAFREAIRAGSDLWTSLTKSTPRTLRALEAKIAKYERLEDSRPKNNEKVNAVAVQPTSGTQSQASEKEKKRKHQAAQPAAKAQRLMRTFTRLTISLDELLGKIKNRNYFEWPKEGDAIVTLDEEDPFRYCHYHEGSGHWTRQCVAFKELVEKLIKDGYLHEYVANLKPGATANTNRQIVEVEEEPILVILGQAEVGRHGTVPGGFGKAEAELGAAPPSA